MKPSPQNLQNVGSISCQWFACCPNVATGTLPHIALGDVPTCDSCHAFATDTVRCRASAPGTSSRTPQEQTHG